MGKSDIVQEVEHVTLRLRKVYRGHLALLPRRPPLSTSKYLTLVSVLLAPQAGDILNREFLVDISQEEENISRKKEDKKYIELAK